MRSATAFASARRDDMLRSKALAKGLINEHQALTADEALQLVFLPGFSTKEVASSVSGRGVGMDVVRRNIVSLRGTVEVASSEGLGSTFTIRLPLTLAIIDGFLLRVGHLGFIVPLDSVLECLEWQESERIPGSSCIKLRGQAMPCIRLSELFGLGNSTSRRENVVIVACGKERVGLVVDQLAGQCQTVIKPLGELFRPLKGIAGSTVLGNGEVALIIDLQGLLELQKLRVGGADPQPSPQTTS